MPREPGKSRQTHLCATCRYCLCCCLCLPLLIELPLHVALYSKASLEVIRELLKAGPDAVVIPGFERKFPLHSAIEDWQEDWDTQTLKCTIEALLEISADAVKMADNEGRFILQLTTKRLLMWCRCC